MEIDEKKWLKIHEAVSQVEESKLKLTDSILNLLDVMCDIDLESIETRKNRGK